MGCDMQEGPLPQRRSPDITDQLRQRLRDTCPTLADEQIDALMALAKEYGEQLREARKHATA